jgi:hypothetical protein
MSTEVNKTASRRFYEEVIPTLLSRGILATKNWEVIILMSTTDNW